MTITGLPSKKYSRTDMKRTLVLGLGNEILSDDGVGIAIAQELERRLETTDLLRIRATCEMGIALMDYIIGTDICLIVDAVKTCKASPGTIFELEEKDLSCISGAAPHFIGVREVLSMGRILGFSMPEKVRIFAIEAKDPYTIGTTISEEVQQAIPLTVSMLIDVLKSESDAALLFKEVD
jgi:hydrogenase maturation protease